MKNECGKVSFINEKFANEYIEKLQKTSTRQRKPIRAYLCSQCLTWHLTSKTEFDEDEIKVLKEKVKQKNILITALNKRINELKTKLRFRR